MPPHQARPEWQEVPLAACGFQHFQGVDADPVEDDRQLVHKGNVQVALGVFNDLGGFGHLDGAGPAGAGRDDAGVKRVHFCRNGGRAAAGDLLDLCQGVDLVAGVDALGAVAAVKPPAAIGCVHISAVDVGEIRESFQHRHADLFGGAGIDGGLVNHQVTRLERLTDRLAGPLQRCQVRGVGDIHRRGHGDDEDAAVGQLGRVAAEAQVRGRTEFFRRDLQRAVAPRLQLSHAPLVDVKPQHRPDVAKLHRQGQAYITQANDGNGR